MCKVYCNYIVWVVDTYRNLKPYLKLYAMIFFAFKLKRVFLLVQITLALYSTVAHAPPAPSPWTHTTVKGTKCVAHQDLEQDWFWPSGTNKCHSLPANDSLTPLQRNVSLQNIVFAFQVPLLCSCSHVR